MTDFTSIAQNILDLPELTPRKRLILQQYLGLRASSGGNSELHSEEIREIEPDVATIVLEYAYSDEHGMPPRFAVRIRADVLRNAVGEIAVPNVKNESAGVIVSYGGPGTALRIANQRISVVVGAGAGLAVVQYRDMLEIARTCRDAGDGKLLLRFMLGRWFAGPGSHKYCGTRAGAGGG